MEVIAMMHLVALKSHMLESNDELDEINDYKWRS